MKFSILMVLLFAASAARSQVNGGAAASLPELGGYLDRGPEGYSVGDLIANIGRGRKNIHSLLNFLEMAPVPDQRAQLVAHKHLLIEIKKCDALFVDAEKALRGEIARGERLPASTPSERKMAGVPNEGLPASLQRDLAAQYADLALMYRTLIEMKARVLPADERSIAAAEREEAEADAKLRSGLLQLEVVRGNLQSALARGRVIRVVKTGIEGR
ncbi:MAG: hypothetical protein AAB036_12265 [Elusimicrobiota bacterium]